MTAIELDRVTKTYPGFTLGPVSLDIREGEFFGVFGPPASGKTSILRLIAGLARPDSGAVSLAGRVLDRVGTDVAMVFQNLALFPHLSGRDNIVFPLVERRVGRSEIDRRLDQVSEALHVAHILHKRPAEMSGGERQRIALGRALISDSRAILLDEPIAALDARLREETRVELKRLQREKRQTFVYVSHDEEEVMAISDRVAVVIDGRVAQLDTPERIYERPASLEVARAVGSPSMNLFEGRISPDGASFTGDGLAAPLPLPRAVGTGGAATVGIRPEDIHPAAAGAPGAMPFELLSVEALGSYSIVAGKVAGRTILVRVEGNVRGAEAFGAFIAFDPARLHLFAASGARIG